MKRWLGQVVGKEGEDLSRHDKWLCMMYPRLKLLYKLLSPTGSIWISIDDIEVSNLRLILDELFGAGNFVANVLWQKKYAVANDHKTIAPMHDHVLVYRKSDAWQRNLLPRTEEKDRAYRFFDERGRFRPDNYTCNKSAEERPNLYYPVTNPNTGEEIWPSRKTVWRYTRETHEENIRQNLVYWGKDGCGKVPAFKRYKHLLKNEGRTVPSSWWSFEFAGHTDEAKKEMRNILASDDERGDFITPKPVRLIERVLQIGSKSDSIVLDSFAGSGTTAHAVLQANQKDGGKRRFILIEMEEYAEKLTAERVRRVMNGYGSEGKESPGLGGGFTFETIGEPVFLEDGNLNEAVGLAALREYAAFAEGLLLESRVPVDNPHSPNLIGVQNETAYVFYWRSGEETILDRRFLAGLKAPAARWVIYADACRISPEMLEAAGITFKKIPRDLRRF